MPFTERRIQYSGRTLCVERPAAARQLNHKLSVYSTAHKCLPKATYTQITESPSKCSALFSYSLWHKRQGSDRRRSRVYRARLEADETHIVGDGEEEEDGQHRLWYHGQQLWVQPKHIVELVGARHPHVDGVLECGIGWVWHGRGVG